MKKLLIFLLLGIFFISFTSATVETLGTFKQHKCVNLIQSGAGLTECNITSVKYPNSTNSLGQVSMTLYGGEFNYTFCNTELNGQYICNGFCGNGSDYIYWAYDFNINPSGLSLNVGILITFLFIILAIFILSFYKIFNSNSRVELLTFAITSYFLLLIFLFMAWKTTENYLYNMEWIINLFYIIFLIFLVLMFPFIIALILYLFYNMFTEKNMKEMIDMGYSPEEAKKFK